MNYNTVGHELQHFSKTTAVTSTFGFSSAIVQFVKPNLSGGPQTSAKVVVMSAFFTNAVKWSARNFAAKLKVWKLFEYNAEYLKLLMLFQCENPLLLSNLRKPARLAPKIHLFGQWLLSGQWHTFRFLKYYVATASLDDGNQDVNIHSRLSRTPNYVPGRMLRPAVNERILQNFDEKFEMCDSKWPIRQIPKIVKEAENAQKTIPTHLEREHPATEVSPKLSCGAISLGRRPANYRTRRMAQKMKKLRSLHILHVPSSRSRTSWHWRLMFPQSVVPYLWFLQILGDVWFLFSFF